MCLSSTLVAHDYSKFPNEFFDYHLQAAVDEIEDQDVFNLIQENVNNLKIAGVSDYAKLELLNLIEEGFKIDRFNMAKLIEVLQIANACDNATEVLIKAIEYQSVITRDHMMSLLDTLLIANPANNATKVIIKAIEEGVEFGPKERLRLAEISRTANARENVEKIRKALHERALAENAG